MSEAEMSAAPTGSCQYRHLRQHIFYRVSSRYSRRSESEYRKVAEYIREVVLSKSGNYMIFFPSYQYMEQVEYAVEDMDFPADLLVQGQGMKEQERQEFLEEFEKPRDHSLAAFCVMGGVFSEGIDLKKERLIGAVIVGTGLPMVCVEQEVLRGYFEEKKRRDSILPTSIRE
mgnify:CR=1 FL=1